MIPTILTPVLSTIARSVCRYSHYRVSLDLKHQKGLNLKIYGVHIGHSLLYSLKIPSSTETKNAVSGNKLLVLHPEAD